MDAAGSDDFVAGLEAVLLGAEFLLALLLGADLGSALMAQVLFLPVQALIPFALIAGIVTFFKARSRKAKQIGRILTGFALVLTSLGMIRAAATPRPGTRPGATLPARSQCGTFSTALCQTCRR